MNRLRIGTMWAVVSLAGLASAQTVDYTILGSVSSQWTDKPWPNVNYNPGSSNPFLYFDFAGHGQVMFGDTIRSWLFGGGFSSAVRVVGQAVPGVPSATWGSGQGITPRIVPTADGFIWTFSPTLQRYSLRSAPSGFSIEEATLSVNDDGMAIVQPSTGGLSIGPVGGPYTEILSAAIGPFRWRPEWTVNGQPGFLLGVTRDGSVWGVASRIGAPTVNFLFLVNPSTGASSYPGIVGQPIAGGRKAPKPRYAFRGRVRRL